VSKIIVKTFQVCEHFCLAYINLIFFVFIFFELNNKSVCYITKCATEPDSQSQIIPKMPTAYRLFFGTESNRIKLNIQNTNE